MIVNEIKRSFKSTNLKHNTLESLAFKKLPLVHKILLERMVITSCYSNSQSCYTLNKKPQ